MKVSIILLGGIIKGRENIRPILYVKNCKNVCNVSVSCALRFIIYLCDTLKHHLAHVLMKNMAPRGLNMQFICNIRVMQYDKINHSLSITSFTITFRHYPYLEQNSRFSTKLISFFGIELLKILIKFD